MRLSKSLRCLLVGELFLCLLAKAENPSFEIEDYVFRGATDWKMASGKVVRFRWLSKEKTEILVGQNLLGTIFYPEVITQIIRSAKGKTLLLLIDKERTTGGLDYSGLGSIAPGPGSNLSLRRVLPAAHSAMSDKQKWVSELGAVSDDGVIALFKMGTQSNRKAPYSVDYTWETWDLRTPRHLKTGLSLGVP